MRARPYARGDALLGEGPRWLPARQELCWVDLLDGTVLHRGEDGGAALVARFPGETASALVPLANGDTAVVLRRRIAVLDASGRETSERAVAEVGDGLRFSDATAGPSGHLWLGVVRETGSRDDGFLLRLGADGVAVARDRLGFSNGLGFSADGRRLFHIDSDAATISVIEHDPRSGGLGAGEVLFRWEGAAGALDGMAVDEWDRIWVAVFGGGIVLCIDDTGRVVERVEVPARRVSSCCFGGDELYITTARVDASEAELIREPEAGSVFRCSTGCSGGPVWEGNSWA